MEDYSDFLDFPFMGEYSEEPLKSLLVVEDGERKCFFLCGEDNWDYLAGRNLLDLSLEAGFVFNRLIQLLASDGFMPTNRKPDDIRYVITSNCRTKKISCIDQKTNVELDPCQFMTFEQLQNSGIEPSMETVIESTEFADNSLLSDEEWEEYYRLREKEKEWQPVYSIDLDNPKQLTWDQIERGKKLYEILSEFIAHQSKDDHRPPEVCITQNWEISIDFGGWRHDTDIVRSALCLMCEDEVTGEFYLDEEYVKQCIPYLEDELRDLSDESIVIKNGNSEIRKSIKDIRFDMEWKFSKIVMDYLKNGCSKDSVIAIDPKKYSVFHLSGDMEITDESILTMNPDEFVLRELGKKPIPDHHKIAKLIKSILP